MKLLSPSALLLAGLFAPAALFACSDASDGGGTGGTPGGGLGTGGTGGGGLGTGGAASGGQGTGGASGGSTSGGTGGLGAAGDGAGGTGGDGTGGGESTESDGCGTETQQATGTWVETTVDVGGSDREYSTWLPSGYDPERAYPVVFVLHGCGSGENNLPMQGQTGSDAIVVRGTGSRNDGCWYDTADSPDMDYLDAMVDDVQARFCTDTSQFFAVGYSSGSWLANQLSCVRSEVWRGLASVTGGEPDTSGCGDPVARMFVHDAGDNTNLIAWSREARDRMLETNSCDDPPATDPVDPSPCVSYRGCLEDYPVVWCETTGQGHGRQDNFAAPAFWDFFQSLGD